MEDCLAGYGIKKSSVSRQWKAATAGELKKLCTRPVPRDLVALMIDGKHLRQDGAVVALGVDGQGNKHVLGVWHGASENSGGRLKRSWKIWSSADWRPRARSWW